MEFYLVVLLLAASTMLSLVSSDYQGDALYELGSSLNASSDQLSTWDRFQTVPCTWLNVICDYDNNVISVTLSGMGFSGSISPSIAVLKSLEVLNLADNNIIGEIPMDFGNLSSLVSLDLRNNHLTGKIPSSLGNLTMLKYLVLSQNYLNGSIPDSFADLPSLANLQLASNDLSGHIPDRLFQISKYNYSDNNLNCGEPFSRLCASDPSYAPMTGSLNKLNLGSILGIAGAIVFLLGGAYYIQWKYRNKAEQDTFVDVAGEVDYQDLALGQLKRFSWKELQLATDNFNKRNKLGKGGFGEVCKGVLADNKKVAIKRLLDHNKPGMEQALVYEVRNISFAVHKNIIKLIGFCTTPSELVLVYPYMENRSVAYHLRGIKHGERALDWPRRKRVALGTARGLQYLHEQCKPKIIHRDIKASNVLLDENFEPVIGDFGLAKLVDIQASKVTTKVRGTLGYMDPAYLSTGKLSTSTDVFAFGVMLLELVTGQQAVDHSRVGKDNEEYLYEHVKKLQKENRLLDIIDRNLNENHNREEIEKMIEIAVLCTQSPNSRPCMSEVLSILECVGDHSRPIPTESALQ